MQREYKATSFHKLIQPIAKDLQRHGVHRPARSEPTIEFPHAVTLTMTNPDAGTFRTAGRHTSARYLSAELLWYLSRSRGVGYIGQYATLWNHIADDSKMVNSNYGYHMLGSEWAWLRQTLIDDPWTRQAVVAIHGKDHHYRPNKDVPCTMHAVFNITKSPFDELRLNMHVVMRSSDFHFGLPYDIPWFTFYLKQLVLSLKPHFENLRCGSLSLTTHSLHSYERNHDTLTRMASQPATGYPFPEADNLYIKNDGTVTPRHDTFFKFLRTNVDAFPWELCQ